MNQNDLSPKTSNQETPRLQKTPSVRSSCTDKSSNSSKKGRIRAKRTISEGDEYRCSTRLSAGISIPRCNVETLGREMPFKGLARIKTSLNAADLVLAHLFDEIEKYKGQKFVEISETDESGVEEMTVENYSGEKKCGNKSCCDCYGCTDAEDGHDGLCGGLCPVYKSRYEQDDEDEEQLFYTEAELQRMFQERVVDNQTVEPLEEPLLQRERNIPESLKDLNTDTS